VSGGGANVPRWLWLALAVVAIVSLLAETAVRHHASFGVDGTFGFYVWYTVACAAAGVGLARLVGAVLRRGDDYHD